MLDIINTYSAEIISTVVVLTPLAYAIKGRLINDKNMLATFQTASKSIAENVKIKFDVENSINLIENKIEKIDNDIKDSVDNVNAAITDFMESELYLKMLEGLSQMDELHQTLQNKDATIEMLTQEIKETNKKYQEILNLIKE